MKVILDIEDQASNDFKFIGLFMASVNVITLRCIILKQILNQFFSTWHEITTFCVPLLITSYNIG